MGWLGVGRMGSEATEWVSDTSVIADNGRSWRRRETGRWRAHARHRS